MHSCKPDLFNVLIGHRCAPQIVPKVAAAFVDRHGMAAHSHVGVLRCIGQLQWIPDPSHGTYCVPYPNELQRAVAAKSCLEALRNFEGMDDSAGLSGSFGVHPSYVGNESLVLRVQKSEHV